VVVTSPPYEKALSGSGADAARKRIAEGRYHGLRPDVWISEGNIAGSTYGNGYSEDPSNIGNQQGDTYWGAVKDVYLECLKSLKPGGVMAVVVKAFVRNKQIVDLPSQTLELLEAIGFEPLERIRAWVTSKATQKSLIPDMVEDYQKSRKSFFRRLAESKGSPAIDFEEVLIVKKLGV